MTRPQHTPGPWSLCAHLRDPEHDQRCRCRYRGGVWGEGGETLVCEMGGTPDVEGTVFLPSADRPQMLANAALIAAAPDMLAALEYLVSKPHGEQIHDAFDMAQRAIAKARGA